MVFLERGQDPGDAKPVPAWVPPRDVPVLCGIHERDFRRNWLGLALTTKKAVNDGAEALLVQTRACHYCLRRRGDGPFECCAPQPMKLTDHEHFWLPEAAQRIASQPSLEVVGPVSAVGDHRRSPDTGDPTWLGPYGPIQPHQTGCLNCMEAQVVRCRDCGLAVEECGSYADRAFLHTCQGCRTSYRDSDPLSAFCSLECVGRAIETVCISRVDTLVLFITDETQSAVLRGSAKWQLSQMTTEDHLESVRAFARSGMERLARIPGQDQILARAWSLG